MTSEESHREPNDESNSLITIPSNQPGRLLLIAGAVLALGVGAALAYYAQYVFASGGHLSGWGIASATFSLVNSAVYAPALLLGLVGLLLVRSDERRDQAAMMTSLIMLAIWLLVLSGCGGVVCIIGGSLSEESTPYGWGGWSIAGQTLTFASSVLYEIGVLLALVYILRLQERRYNRWRASRCSQPEAEGRRPDGCV